MLYIRDAIRKYKCMNNLAPKYLRQFVNYNTGRRDNLQLQKAGQSWLNNRLDTGVHEYGTHIATNYVIANHWSHLRGF